MLTASHDLDSIKQKDLPQIIHSKGIPIKPNGTGYTCRCPFHNDHTPSLHINRKNGVWVWHCFGCDAGGTVIDFIMKYDSLNFQEATKQLSGGQIVTGHDLQTRQAQEIKLLAKVSEYYHKVFFEDRRGYEYLVQERKIKDPEIFRDFKIGFCNGSLNKILPEDEKIITSLKSLGILNAKGNEHFYNCVVFPILDEEKQVVGLYGRNISSNNGHGHLYLAGPHRGVFNGHVLKHYSEIFIVEGIIDCLSLYQEGFKNVIPLYGTNGFTKDHEALLRKYNPKKVYLLLDGDEAGRKASHRLKEKIEDGFSGTRCYVLSLPDGEDPNSYLGAHTGDEFRALLEAHKDTSAQDTSEGEDNPLKGVTLTDGFQVQYGERLYQIRGIEGSSGNKLKANIRVIHRKKFFIDTIDLYSARLRRGFIKDAANLYREEEDIIEHDMDQILEACEKYISTRLNEAETKKVVISEKDQDEAIRFGKSQNLMDLILKDFNHIGIVGEETNKLLGYLAMTSRKTEDPLSLLIISGSGSGKSLLQDGILSFCPEEDLIKLTAITEKALFYKKETSLKHKVIAIEEDRGADEASYAIRNLISSKMLMIEATIKDPLTGKMTTMNNTVKGPASVFKTTTRVDTDPETRSRFLITSVDESLDQTRKILELQRQNRTIEGYLKKKERYSVIKKHQNFQRLLKPIVIINPFSPLLTYLDDRMLVRRENPKYLQLIETITFLHQMSRSIKETDHHGERILYIEVTLEDIQTANMIASEVFGRSLDELTEPSRRLLIIIDEMVINLARESGRKKSEINFTRRQIREYSKWSDYQIRAHIRELQDKEYLMTECGHQGSLYSYRLAYNGEGIDGQRFVLGLINTEELRKKAIKTGILI